MNSASLSCQLSRYFILFSIFMLFTTACAPQKEISPVPPAPAQVTASVAPTMTPAATLPEATSTPTASPTPPPNAPDIPDPNGFTWQEIASGLSRPLGLVTAPGEPERLYVVEQDGLVKILQGGEVLAEPFIDLRDRASTRGSSVRGLLGLVFHPNYAENGVFFVHYTDSSGKSIISRFDGLMETKLLQISYPEGEHIGGDLAFGADGYLYISIGDGGRGGYGDQAGNAQNPNTLPGSLLRLDVDNGSPYAIPPDNPFASGGGLPEVWAIGLRNSWRFTFDPLTDDLYIADVGENSREEIDFLPANSAGGANFGWNYLEGSVVYKSQPPGDLKIVLPVIEYDHSQGCSVTGGQVYRGDAMPEWAGVYFYADYCSGNIWGLLKKADGSWENKLLFNVPAYITTFGTDAAGEIYLAGQNGRIYKLVRE